MCPESPRPPNNSSTCKAFASLQSLSVHAETLAELTQPGFMGIAAGSGDRALLKVELCRDAERGREMGNIGNQTRSQSVGISLVVRESNCRSPRSKYLI